MSSNTHICRWTFDDIYFTFGDISTSGLLFPVVVLCRNHCFSALHGRLSHYCSWQTRQIVFTVRCYAERGYATVSRLTLCLSVRPWRRDVQVCFFHTGWKTSKIIISRLISLRHLLTLTQTWSIWCNVNSSKLWWNRDGGHGTQKPPLSPKRCKIGPRLLWRNRKSHTHFRLVPNSMTLDDLECWKRHSCRNKKLRSPPQKFQRK